MKQNLQPFRFYLLLVRESRDPIPHLSNQSIFAPEIFTAFSHLTISERRNAPSSFGDDDCGFAPSYCRRCASSGVSIARLSAAFSFSTTGTGVPAGASKQYQVATSNPGSPDSLMVGV